MEKIESARKRWSKVLLGVLAVLSILWTTPPVHAVGPYFENESPGRGQFEGPSPNWPRPDASLWSPPSPLPLAKESLKKADIVLRKSKESGKAEAAAQDVIDPPAGKNIASLMERRTP